MDNKYKILFGLIAKSAESIAEETMNFNKDSNDLQAYKTAKEMRSKYARLNDLLNSKTVNYKLTKNDVIDLYVGSRIVVSQLEARINKEKTALQGYKFDLLPKLEQAIKEFDKFDEIFSIQEETNN